MSKKKKEVCPYCQMEFIYLSRHKCKVRQRMESDDDETELERQQKRFDDKRKEITRKLKKDELSVLKIVDQEKQLLLSELKEKADISSDKLERILDTLEIKSKIKVSRELTTGSWTKHISIVEDIKDKVSKKQKKVSTKADDYIWNMIWRVPCFLCPFMNRCDISQVKFNPHTCTWFTDWIWSSLDNKKYSNPFEEIDEKVYEV